LAAGDVAEAFDIWAADLAVPHTIDNLNRAYVVQVSRFGAG
jgi:hypothetical protein